MMITFQLPRSTHFGFRAFKSFQAALFLLLHPLQAFNIKLPVLFCIVGLFSHSNPGHRGNCGILANLQKKQHSNIFYTEMSTFIGWLVFEDPVLLF